MRLKEKFKEEGGIRRNTRSKRLPDVNDHGLSSGGGGSRMEKKGYPSHS